ncbi:MAG: electron transport complex subunit RsxG [Aquisalimonadaceae bacterium]
MNETRATIRAVLIAGGLLLAFALAGVGMVALTYEQTLERIAENRRLTMLRQLQTVIPPGIYDNRPDQDTLMVRDPTLLGSAGPLTVYRARLDGEPTAAILTVVAPDGYSGNISLLVGVFSDGRLSGVRVISHQETPGLGDAIERERSTWISGFDNRSLEDPPRDGWRVRRDGGEFDHITGATITSRAVIKAVRNALLYFEQHRDTLLDIEAGTSTETSPAKDDGEETEGAARSGD